MAFVCRALCGRSTVEDLTPEACAATWKEQYGAQKVVHAPLPAPVLTKIREDRRYVHVKLAGLRGGGLKGLDKKIASLGARSRLVTLWRITFA